MKKYLIPFLIFCLFSLCSCDLSLNNGSLQIVSEPGDDLFKITQTKINFANDYKPSTYVNYSNTIHLELINLKYDEGPIIQFQVYTNNLTNGYLTMGGIFKKAVICGYGSYYSSKKIGYTLEPYYDNNKFEPYYDYTIIKKDDKNNILGFIAMLLIQDSECESLYHVKCLVSESFPQVDGQYQKIPEIYITNKINKMTKEYFESE